MATHQYRCGSDARRRAVRDSTTVNGVDFLEVAEDQRRLLVRFVHPLPGGTAAVPPPPAPPLTAANLVIEGGVRRPGITVVDAVTDGDLLTVTVDTPGDFSTYLLRLRATGAGAAGGGPQGGPQGGPPSGFDPQLASVEFSFKAGCASDFDCAVEQACAPAPLPEPEIDYLAKDYDSFRRLLLDRLAALLPDWDERNPADEQIALVELLAYAADRLSYHQDAVAGEAYLGSARRRVSVRRHARLLDYRVHDGANARAFVHLRAGQDGQLAAGGVLLAGSPGGPPLTFAPIHALTLRTAHNDIGLYTWSEEECCLPAGATRATLVNAPARGLAPGDLLLLEETVSPNTGLAADADPSHRQVVRLTRTLAGTDALDGSAILEVEWGEADALRFPLCVSARVATASGALTLVRTAVARGNIVLADHGRTVADEPLLPSSPPQQGRWRPRLQQGPLTFAAPFDPAAPASTALGGDPRLALPAVRIRGQGLDWSPRPDLLASDGLAAEFVVETEDGGVALPRFGDGTSGREPDPGATFTATYRIGNGSVGNVPAETITAVDPPDPRVVALRNPLPAAGGVDPEPVELVRLLAPQAFRRQERAVTAADYARMAERHPGVHKAVASFRWTGSWHTVFVAVDRGGGRAVTAAFEQGLRDHLERYRSAGYDLEVTGPVPVPLYLALEVCVHDGFFAKDVEAALLDALGAGRGFFHPDNFTFGQPLYLSQVYQAGLAIPGVAWVNATAFQRFGRVAGRELEAGVIQPGALEIVQLANDPNFPERGKLELSMAGGR